MASYNASLSVPAAFPERAKFKKRSQLPYEPAFVVVYIHIYSVKNDVVTIRRISVKYYQSRLYQVRYLCLQMIQNCIFLLSLRKIILFCKKI